VVICLERVADLHTAQLMPLLLTVSCSSKIQIGFTFLVPVHLGSPGQRAVKRMCVCVASMMDCVLSGSLLVAFSLFCYAVCFFFEQINSLSLSPPPLSALWASYGKTPLIPLALFRQLAHCLRPYCCSLLGVQSPQSMNRFVVKN